MKTWRYELLAILVTCLFFAGVKVVIAHLGTQPQKSVYRSLEESLAIHRQQGWTVFQTPAHPTRYLPAGGLGYGDLGTANVPAVGAFQKGARKASFNIKTPPGMDVYVEGLDPEHGGDLEYAVLIRPTEQNVLAPHPSP